MKAALPGCTDGTSMERFQRGGGVNIYQLCDLRYHHFGNAWASRGLEEEKDGVGK